MENKSMLTRLVLQSTMKTLLRSISAVLTITVLQGCDAFESSPHPVIKSELVVPDLASLSLTTFGWIDDHRVVVIALDKNDPLPKGPEKWRNSIKIWDVDTNTVETISPTNAFGLCVSGNFIRFYLESQDSDGKPVREFYAGPVDKVEKTLKAGRIIEMSCLLQDDLPLPVWAKMIPKPERSISYLHQEHGFFVIEWVSDTEWKSVQFFPPGRNKLQGIDVSRIFGHDQYAKRLTFHAIWHPEKNAYYINQNSANTSPWWFYLDGRLEQAQKIDRLRLVFPKGTLAGLTRLTAADPIIDVTVLDRTKIHDGGLYSIPDASNPKRLVAGRIGSAIKLSSSGCKAAFTNDDRPFIDPRTPLLYRKLQVINLCKEYPTKRISFVKKGSASN